MEKEDMKKLVLDYLQLHKLDLISQIASLNEVKFEDNPPRIVLCLARETDDLPEIKFMGKLLPVEKVVTGEPVVLKHDKEQLPMPEKSSTAKDDGLFHHNDIEGHEAISPFSEPENTDDKTKKAFEEWKKRWPSVKVDK
jgi:hypothetical protein